MIITIILIAMSFKVLFLGEVVGRAGILAVKNGLKALKDKVGADFVIANTEGATNGFGLGKAHSMQLSHLGINLQTGGEKIFYKLDMVDFFPKCSYVLRPANFPPKTPGKGYKIVEINGKRVAIINILGASGFSRICVVNPLNFADMILSKLSAEADIFLIQFHCATTAESATLAHYLKDRVSAVITTHSKVLTSDSKIIGKCAFISDNGRCGSTLSAGGFNPEYEIKKLMTALPDRSHEAWEDCELQGVLVTISDDGNAEKIEVIKEKVAVERPEVSK